VERLGEIAERHGLKVVYDAAHAFGVRYRGRPLAAYGDATALSFHATKLFHTVEGGGVATGDPEVAHRLAYMRNFGHRGQEAYWGLGINAKASELHAAMGLCLLPRVAAMIAARRERVERYRELLAPAGIVTWRVPEHVSWNYGYFPVVFDSEATLLAVREALAAEEVYPRRYFYPALTELPYVARTQAPAAESLARRVLCLPLWETLALEDVERVAALVLGALERRL
jgi:dTDP-4-amino-4,6-dideoxygalactose transaminase